MLELLTHLDCAAVAQLVVIDILLGGDNALVIALACRKLPPDQRWRGIVWGSIGAIALRIVLVAFAVTLLQWPAIKIVGGVALLWIGIKLVEPEDDDLDRVKPGVTLFDAIRTVIVADLIMSVDNVIGIAGASQQTPPDQQIWYVVFGLIVSIPCVVFGSQLILRLIDRFPMTVVAGAALLGFVAGQLIESDPLIAPYTSGFGKTSDLVAGIAGAALVVVVGQWFMRRGRDTPTRRS